MDAARGRLWLQHTRESSHLFGSLGRGQLGVRSRTLIKFNIQAKRTHLLNEHIKTFRNARFEDVIAAYDRFIDLCTAGHVIRFYSQHFLQSVGRSVSLKRPDFHLAESLAAKLCLAAKRLLSDKTVRPNRTRMDLIIDEMMQ